ncbi:Heat shock transcription factor, partial [Coemansia spiralis]
MSIVVPVQGSILESGRYDCLRWSHDGKRVVITSRSAIVNLVLPGYFETLKFDSFTRQFHIYEFRRTTDNRKAKDPDGYCEFHHPNFKRGRPDLLDKIPRKKTLKGLASGESPPDRNGVLQRIRTLNLKGGSVEPTSMQLDMVSGAPSAMATLAGLPPNVLAAIGHDPALFGVPSSAAYPAADPGGFNTNPHASFMDAFATSLITDPVTEELFKTLQHAANLADQVPVI